MSTNHNIYIGPFIAFDNPENTVAINIHGCSLCNTHTKESFCSRCGLACVDYRQQVRRSIVRRIEASEEICEALSVTVSIGSVDYWIGNHSDKCPLPWENEQGESVFEIPPDLISGQIKAFSRDYKRAIETLRKVYGQDAPVQWGRIEYWS